MSLSLKKRLVLFFALGFLLAGWLLSHQALVRVALRTDVRGAFKIYWAGSGEVFSEARSASAWISPGRTQYAFFLADLGKIRRLRIDPLDKPGNVVISSIAISQAPYETILISARENFGHLKPLKQITKLAVKREGIAVATAGKDPQLEIAIDARKGGGSWLASLLKIAVLAALFGLLLELAARVPSGFQYAPRLMIFILGLIMAMSLVSRFNMHPDEYVHVQAATFYEDHWLPPAICSPEAAGTYSVHGVSRLDSLEIVYFFAGKFSRLLRVLPMAAHLRLRFFNILLFGILLWLCLAKGVHRILYLPLLVSPQVWYIFSYFNSDAFSLFICFLLGYMVVEKQSPVNRLLFEDQAPAAYAGRLVGTGLLLAMVPLMKLNFYFFGIFLTGFLVIRFIENRFSMTSRAWKRLGLIVVVAMVFAGGRYGFDVYQNGWHRSRKLTECRNQQARPRFKPDTPLEKQYFGLNLRKRGVSVRQMFDRYGWGRISFQSTFGVYGYMSLYGSALYYQAMKYLLLLLSALLLWSALVQTPLFTKLDLANVIFCALALVAAAFWNSWNVDLQNQGRYFLPIFAMTGMVLVQMEKRISAKLLNLLVIAMFILGAYSFLFYGLSRIPKV
jgi:hypothetical protein